jgi:hypothetical protein
MRLSGEQPRQGHRYVVNSEFEAIVLTQWLAPFTGGSKRLLPAGMEFIVLHDPPEMATAISARPVPPEHWEALLVNEKERTAEKYDGYAIVISFDCLEAHCSRQQLRSTEAS